MPPKLQAEQDELMQYFFDNTPEEVFERGEDEALLELYFKEHASPELLKERAKIDKILERAKKNGIRI